MKFMEPWRKKMKKEYLCVWRKDRGVDQSSLTSGALWLKMAFQPSSGGKIGCRPKGDDHAWSQETTVVATTMIA